MVGQETKKKERENQVATNKQKLVAFTSPRTLSSALDDWSLWGFWQNWTLSLDLLFHTCDSGLTHGLPLGPQCLVLGRVCESRQSRDSTPGAFLEPWGEESSSPLGLWTKGQWKPRTAKGYHTAISYLRMKPTQREDGDRRWRQIPNKIN